LEGKIYDLNPWNGTEEEMPMIYYV